jgi:uncharacterized protein (DUF169 family)
MDDLEKYREFGQDLIDKLKLLTYPIAVKIMKEGDEMPKGNFFRPHKFFGYFVPTCTTHYWVRTSGYSFYLEGEDISCAPSSYLYYGLEESENHPETVYKAWAKYAGFKKDIEAEKSSRATDYTFKPGEIKGLLLSPLNNTLVKPDVVLIYCISLALGSLILSATYEGDCINSEFNGMEASCKGVVKTYKTNQCNVACPGLGDRTAGNASAIEMLFFIPENKLEMVTSNLFKAGNKQGSGFGPASNPYAIPHIVGSVGSNRIFGSVAVGDAPQWRYSRKRNVKNKK